MKCTKFKDLYMKTKCKEKRLYLNYIFKSIKEVAILMPKELLVMVLSNIIFIIASRYTLVLYMNVFNKLQFKENTLNMASNIKKEYALNSLKIVLPAIFLYLLYEFIVKLKNTYYERYATQFKSLIKFEEKSKIKIQKKCKNIESFRYLENEMQEKIYEAEVSGTNIFRITESVIDQMGIFVNIIVLSSVFLKINKIYLVIIFASTIPTLLSGIIKGNNNREFRKKVNKSERKRKELRDSIVKPEFAAENKVLNINDYLILKYETFQRENVALNLKFNKMNFNVDFIASIIMGLGYVIAYSLSIYLLMKNRNIGDFLASIMGFNLISNSISNLINYQNYVNMFSKMVKPYFDLIDIPDLEKLKINNNGEFKSIELKDVSLKYPGSNTNSLNNISLKINKGEKIAVVGLNGSGKTTLSKLILGLYKSSKGEYIYNGEVLNNNYDFEELFINKAAVFQNFKRYPMSLIDNVSISQEDLLIDEDRVKNILREIDFNIEKENIKLDENLGKELGYRDLSGGQWQKIAIARCIYKDADFIVFDEPTSAIDPIFEMNVYKAMDKLLINKTGLIITHKLASIKFVDKILVLNNGNIEGFSNHEDLLRTCTKYRELWEASKEAFIS